MKKKSVFSYIYFRFKEFHNAKLLEKPDDYSKF